MSIFETNYFKVDVEYLQESQLLVAATDEAEAVKMVEANVLETTKGFKINGVAPLTEDEKKWVIANMTGEADETSTEERTIN